MRLRILLLMMAWAGSLSQGLSAPGSPLSVRHDHDPWGACQGLLTIDDQGIQYRPQEKKDHERDWSWTDIQTVDRLSVSRFTILTYQDQPWLAGRDRPWDFRVLDPEGEGLSDEVFQLVLEHSPRPVVDRIVRELTSEYEVPVKHLHTFGGCEGVLRFGTDWIVYLTENKKDARTWRKAHEVANIWSTHPFDLEFEVYEKDAEDLLKTRRFRFQLKQRLDEKYYTGLRREFLPAR